MILMLSLAHPAASRELTASSMHLSTKCCISSASCSCHLRSNVEKGVQEREVNVISAPRMRIILRKFKLMLSDYVRVLVEYYEAH
jgi:hypothetical protein